MAIDMQSLESIQNLTPPAIVQKAEEKHMRMDQLKEIALGLGARAGMAKREQQINDNLMKRAAQLDVIFDFKPMLISEPIGKFGNTNYQVLPPVITEAQDVYEMNSDTAIHLADHTYHIDQQAKFISVAPSWRTYLILTPPGVEQPHSSLLPNDSTEKEAWKGWVADGWKLGVAQADAIESDALARLKRDLTGMAKYHMLYKAKMVSAPFVAESRVAVSGGGEDMALNDQTLMITALPGLKPDSKSWETNNKQVIGKGVTSLYEVIDNPDTLEPVKAGKK